MIYSIVNFEALAWNVMQKDLSCLKDEENSKISDIKYQKRSEDDKEFDYRVEASPLALDLSNFMHDYPEIVSLETDEMRKALTKLVVE